MHDDVWLIGDWDDIETSLIEDITNGELEMRKYKIVFKRNGSRRKTTRIIEASSEHMAIQQLKGSYSNEDTFEFIEVTIV